MKDLFLMRHGKAEQPRLGLRDHARHLAERGLRNAREQALRFEPGSGHAMLVSDATRTRETARTLLDSWRAQGFTLPGNVKITPDGYLASAEDWMDLASTVDVGYSALWIIGHNPGISDLVTVLTGDYLAMATADIVHVGIRGHSWSECGPGAGQILSHSPGRGL